MKKETRKFIEELKRKKQDKIDNGPIDITADQMWKYSGEIEESTNKFNINNPKHYKHTKIKNVPIYNTFTLKEDLVIESYFRNPNRNIVDIAEDLDKSKDFVTKTISKYLEMKKNENTNNE